MKKIIPFTIISPKYLGVNLTKEVKNLYSENNKTLMNETENKTNGMIGPAYGSEELIFSKCPYYPKQSTDVTQSKSKYK